jgi:hypothetical protein
VKTLRFFSVSGAEKRKKITAEFRQFSQGTESWNIFAVNPHTAPIFEPDESDSCPVLQFTRQTAQPNA